MKSTGGLQSVNQRRWRQLSPLSDSWRRELPFGPGVYAFYGRSNDVLYVGKSRSLRIRVSSYFQSRADLIPKVRIFVPQISKIKIFETKTEFEALLVEAKCIRELAPKYNSRLTDDRSPLYIVVTDEKFPRVLTARKTDLGGIEAGSVYGPFLSGETVRRVLKIARRMFPYCNQPRRHLERPKGVERSKRFLGFARNDKRKCFYRHLSLCPGVCSGEISRRRYLSIIKKLEQFLAGDFAGLKVKLEREMKTAAKRQEFEEAAKARDAAAALASLSLAGEYEEEMGIDGEERVKALIKLLSRHSDFRLPDYQTIRLSAKRSGSPMVRSLKSDSLRNFSIEGFDVSNLGGRLATAAMVVFIGGIREIGEYRHFRIKSRRHLERPRRNVGGVERSSEAIRSVPMAIGTRSLGYARDDADADDPRMIAEAVERRLLHPEWRKPDLIVIDGGGPQLRRIRKGILYLGLAKNPDRLVIPSGNGFKTIRVSARDLGFQLLQQVRDEAHRFSRRLHLKLRRKMIIR